MLSLFHHYQTSLENYVGGHVTAKVRNGSAVSRWQTAFTTAVGQFPIVPGHNGNNPTINDGSPFGSVAPRSRQPRRTLVDVCIIDWLAGLDHLHEAHGHGSDDDRGSHQDAVRASGP